MGIGQIITSLQMRPIPTFRRSMFKENVKIERQNKKHPAFSFDQPPYDERSSCFINAGTKHGVGKTQPVGKFKASNCGAIPKGVHVQNVEYK